MEIRVNILGKVAYKENGSREDAEKAELYPFGEGVYGGNGWRKFRCVKSRIWQKTQR